MISSRYLFISSLFALTLLTTCEKKKYPPQLSSVSPNQAAINDNVTLAGNQFGDNPSVLIGSRPAAVVSASDTRITVTVPTMQLGATTIQVQNADGASDPLPFTVLQSLPSVTSFSPQSGRVGTEVTLSGVFLDSVTEIRFSGGASSAASFQWSGGSLRAVVPANAMTGTVCVRTGAGQTCSFSTFTVEVPQAAPTIGGVSPGKGIAGTEITISGQNLQNTQEVRIGSQAVAIKSNTSTSLKVDAPTFSSVQNVAITVRTSGGTSTGGSFTGAPQADINQTPTPNGLISGGPLTLKGANFSSVTSVDFMNDKGEVNATVSSQNFLPSDPGVVIVKVPVGVLAGYVRVNNEYGVGKLRSIGKLSGNDAITTGNVATNVGSLLTGVISDGCDPTSFFYCSPNRTYEIGFKNYSSKCLVKGYTIERIGGKTYETYTAYRYTTSAVAVSTTDVLKLERNSQNTAYTGPVIFIAGTNVNPVTYVGSMTQTGDIYAYSVTDGSLFKLCKKSIQYFSYPTPTSCSDCK